MGEKRKWKGTVGRWERGEGGRKEEGGREGGREGEKAGKEGKEEGGRLKGMYSGERIPDNTLHTYQLPNSV